MFNQSDYSVDENHGSLKAVLILSLRVSNDITVKVITSDNTATGK